MENLFKYIIEDGIVYIQYMNSDIKCVYYSDKTYICFDFLHENLLNYNEEQINLFSENEKEQFILEQNNISVFLNELNLNNINYTSNIFILDGYVYVKITIDISQLNIKN